MSGPILAANRAAAVTAMCLLAACGSLRSPAPFSQTPGSAPATTQPQPGPPAAPAARPPARQYHLGPASTALVSQAHKQANTGDYGLASATIERAMRIEPDNPLLWIELGRVRLAAGDNTQAESMGRKALASGTGDPQVQASAWRLIAEALRALKRNEEAAAADKHASALSPR